MKEINATTTYDPACSDMQEVEYTMPQSKRDITKCLMIALDNFAEAQAEINEKAILISLLSTYLIKAEINVPVEVWDDIDKHKGE